MAHRTQITLSDDQYEILRERSRRTGASLAELVRRAVDESYGPPVRERLGALDASFGAWPEEPGERRDAYLDDLRPGLDARFARRAE